MTKRFALFAALSLLAACSGGGGPLPVAPASAPGLPGARSASASVIPPSAFTSVTLPCGEIDGLAVAWDQTAWFTEPFDCNGSGANDVIGRVTQSGTVTIYHTPTAQSQPFGIVNAGDSQLYAAEERAGKLLQIDPNTGAMTEYPIPAYQGHAPDVRWVGVGPDENVWFTDIAQGATALGTFNIYTHQFSFYPLGMQASADSYTIGGPQGQIWVSNINPLHDGSAPFSAFDTNGNHLAQYQVPDPLGPMTAASDGNVWFTQQQDAATGNSAGQTTLSLGRITPAGVISTFPLPSSDVHDSSLSGIVQGPDGKIYAGLFNNGAIVQSDLSGSMKVFAFPASCPYVQPFLLAPANNTLSLWVIDGGNTKKMYFIDLTQLR